MALNFQNALAGAGTGAAAGSAFGPWGSAIGAGIGGLSGLFGVGAPKQPKIKQQTLQTPEQRRGLRDLLRNPIGQQPLFQQGQDYLQNLLSGSPEAYSAFEAPLMRQFQQQIVPSIAERFAGMGTGAGATNSSAFNQAMAQAAEGLATNLGALRGQMQMQAVPQALRYAQQPYSNLLAALGINSFQPYIQEGSPGFFGPAASGLMQGLGQKFGQSLFQI